METAARLLVEAWVAELREARLAAGLSQHDVARAMGVQRETVAEWETYQRHPTLSNLLHLARELGRVAEPGDLREAEPVREQGEDLRPVRHGVLPGRHVPGGPRVEEQYRDALPGQDRGQQRGRHVPAEDRDVVRRVRPGRPSRHRDQTPRPGAGR